MELSPKHNTFEVIQQVLTNREKNNFLYLIHNGIKMEINSNRNCKIKKYMDIEQYTLE
jgi:hypothetical protein